MKTKISRIKFFNSIKASTKGGAGTQLDYVDISDPKYGFYEISVDGIFVTIVNKESKDTTITTVHNVIYFTPFEE